jgi:hypothetical protein
MLNRVTSSNERVYMILKAVVRLSHPAYMEIVLRKRMCLNIYTNFSITSLTDRLKKKITGQVRVFLVELQFITTRYMRECYGVKCHFQQYFSYIMAVSFIGGEELEYPERTTDLPQVTD